MIKVIIFDFDGTISKVDKGFNCWKAVWEELDAVSVDLKYYNMYLNHEITYIEWCEIIEKEFLSRKVNSQMLEKIGKRIKLMDDIEEFFKILKERNIKSYILSGGIKNMIEASLGEYVNCFEDIQADYFTFDETGNVKNLCLCAGHDVSHKDEYVNIIMKEHNITPGELLFVGNGRNDESVYKTGVHTLCLNPDGAHFEDKRIWHNTIWSESLMDVLPYIK